MAAEEIIFKISADAKGADKSTATLNSRLTAVNQAAKDVSRSMDTVVPKSAKVLMAEIAASTDSFEEKLRKLNVVVKEAPVSIRDMNKQIQAYQGIALAAGRESPIGREAMQAAAALKDRYVDLQNETKRLSDDHKNLKGAMQIGTTIIAGYGALSGVMAMAGGASEDVRKTMVKLQAVQATLAAITQIRTALEKESAMMITILDIKTKLFTKTQALYTFATNATTVATKALRIAMIALPIILIIAAIAALIAALAGFFTETEKAEAMNNELNASMEKSTEAFNRNSAATARAISDRIKLAKAAHASADDIFKLESEGLDDAERSRKKELSLTKENLDAKRKMLILAVKEENEDKTKEIFDEIKAMKGKYADLRAEDRKYFVDKEVLTAANNDRIADEAKAANDKARAASSKYNDEAKARREAAAKLALEEAKLLRDLIIENIEDDDVRKLTALQESHIRQRAEIVEKYGQDQILIDQLERKQAGEFSKLAEELQAAKDAAEKVITDKTKDDAAKAQAKELKSSRAELEGKLIQMRDDFDATQQLKRDFAHYEMVQALAAENVTKGEIFKIKEEYAAKIADLDKTEADKKLALETETAAAVKSVYSSGFTAISTLADGIFTLRIANAEAGSAKELELQKKQFEFSKKLQLSQAIIQGVQGVQAAFTSAQKSPITPFFPAYPALQAGIAAAMAIGNIAKIKATTFNGGGTVSAPSVSAPSVNIPSTESDAADTTTQTAGLEGSAQAIKVTLVTSEVEQSILESKKVDMISTVG